MSFRIKQLGELITQRNFKGVSRYINKLDEIEVSEARTFITTYFAEDKSLNSDDFWHFAEVISTANWLLFRDTIVENTARLRYRINPSISNRSKFKTLLNNFVDNDENISDIQTIISKYRELVDKGCLYILSGRTREFFRPDIYSILCDGAELTFSEYKKILLSDNTLCSLYEYARTLITSDFKGKDGNDCFFWLL